VQNLLSASSDEALYIWFGLGHCEHRYNFWIACPPTPGKGLMAPLGGYGAPSWERLP